MFGPEIAPAELGAERGDYHEGFLARAALLNTKGGNLIIGVIEAKRYKKLLETKLAEYPRYKDKVIFGLENEYRKNEWDGFYQRLISLIETRIGPQVLDAEQVKVKKPISRAGIYV